MYQEKWKVGDIQKEKVGQLKYDNVFLLNYMNDYSLGQFLIKVLSNKTRWWKYWKSSVVEKWVIRKKKEKDMKNSIIEKLTIAKKSWSSGIYWGGGRYYSQKNMQVYIKWIW